MIDHAFLEKKAATNALELLTRWPNDWLDGWVEAMTGIARDEMAHLAQVTRMLVSRGGRLDRVHKNPYANSLRQLVRHDLHPEFSPQPSPPCEKPAKPDKSHASFL